LSSSSGTRERRGHCRNLRRDPRRCANPWHLETWKPMKEKILIWLMSLPWTAADKATETVEMRHDRMTIIAESVADSARGDRLKAAFLLTQFRRETHYDRNVQTCECRRFECDPIKTPDGTWFRAHSLSQAHEENFRDLATWWELCSTNRHAVDLNVAITARYYYPKQLECSYARLAGIRIGCNDRSSVSRAKDARRLSGRL
jgi:hypothetical protein